MALQFDLKKLAEGGGRRASLALPHGIVETPVFMPVGTAATVKAVPQDILETNGANGLGAQIILANTYHLYLRPGHELIRRMGGVHQLHELGPAPCSPTPAASRSSALSKGLRKISSEGVEFRSHLDGSKHFFSPEHSMDVQIALGADIMPWSSTSASKHPASYERTRDSMALTHAWAARSKDHFEANKMEASRGMKKSAMEEQPRPSPSSASSRAACTPTSAANPPSASSRWISPATPSAASPSVNPARSPSEMIARTLEHPSQRQAPLRHGRRLPRRDRGVRKAWAST